MICDFIDIDKIIQSEKLNLCVVSYGGCCSNTLRSTLEQNGYICETEIWKKILCHCPKYTSMGIKVIYIYDDPIRSFLSQKRRGDGIWDVNQTKLCNNVDVELSDENLLTAMIKQFDSWTSRADDDANLLIIHAKELFEDAIVSKLERFLGEPVQHFPITYVEPLSVINNLDIEEFRLFQPYSHDIDRINQYCPPI